MSEKVRKLQFGNKNSFAIGITSNFSDLKIGIIQIWINGVCLGKIEETYIIPNILALSRMQNLSSYSILNINNYSVETVFDNILSDKNLYDLTLLGFGETFDEYVLRSYMYETKIIFLWTFLPNEINKGKENIKKAQFGIVECDEFYTILEECKKKLNI